MEGESVEFKTVKACTVALGKAFKAAGMEISMIHFLEEKGFITESVRLSVIDVKSPLNIMEKANMVVGGIRDRIDFDEESFKELVDKFKQSGVRYEPVAKMLTKEYKKQYAAANPNMAPEAAVSGGGSDGGNGGATWNPSAPQPSTVTSSGDFMKMVDSSLLYCDDLPDVLEAVQPLAGKWSILCTKLHLPQNTLDVIKCNNPGDVVSCLWEALVEWLKLNYDSQRHGRPSWRMLAKAVSSLDYALSEKIASKHIATEP